MIGHANIPKLWPAALGERIEAVFVEEQRGVLTAIEFVFASGLVLQLTAGHLGLASYAAPIFPSEWGNRTPRHWPCIGRTINSVHVWHHPDNDVPQALRLGMEDCPISFRFDDSSVVLESPARSVDAAAEQLTGRCVARSGDPNDSSSPSGGQ